MRHYTQLQRDQLCKISALTAEGLAASRIARSVGVHRATIYAEWSRCGGRLHYCEYRAEFDRLMKRAEGARNASGFDAATWQRVHAELDQTWSPRMISGRARALAAVSQAPAMGEASHTATSATLGPTMTGSAPPVAAPMPSASRIYAWAHTQHEAWWCGRRLRRYGARSARVVLGNNGAPAEHWRGRLNSIEARPEAINERIEARHWEIDTVEGLKRDGARLLVAVERRCLLTRIALLQRCTAQAVAEAVAAWRGRTSAQRAAFASFTPDQGVEFARLETVFPAQHIYLCHKHSPWEKARVENTNGLIRFYVPKGQAISALTVEKLAWIEAQINNRPRETLGWLTANEVASLENPNCRAS